MGWPGFARMKPEAAAGARGFAELALQLTNEGAEALEGLYGSRLAQRCTPVGPKGHRSFTGDEPVRRSVSAPVEGAARA